MKSLIQKSIVTLLSSLFGLAVFPAHAGFSSLYVFGDALSSTTDNQCRSDFTTGSVIPTAGFGLKCWRSGRD